LKVRSINEIKSLDDEINLFEETNWDFMAVVDNHDTNFEYFDDIRDADFDKRKAVNMRDIIPIACLVAVLILCSLTSMKILGVFDKSDYEAVVNIQSVNSVVATTYVDGVEASSEDILAISSVLNKYFNCLKGKDSYDDLYNACLETSIFADTFYSAVDKVNTLYDKNDCYARAIREFGGSCSLSRINKVYIKDNVYYCYANIVVPTTSDMLEYVYLYSYNFTKEFNKYIPTEAGVVKYLLTLMKDNQIPCTSTEVCFEFKYTNGEFKLVDDSYIADTCKDDYTSTVNQIASILGSTLTN
jgi:hypothetical protein